MGVPDSVSQQANEMVMSACSRVLTSLYTDDLFRMIHALMSPMMETMTSTTV